MPDRDEEPILKTLKMTCLSWIPALLATSGLACGMIFSFWCESIVFEANHNNSNNYDDLHFGPWYQLEVSTGTTEVGEYENVYTTKNCVDWEYDPKIDSHWKTTRAFTIVAAILGGFVALALWFVPCMAGRISSTTWSCVAIQCSVVLTLFQGLTFLFFPSDACQNNVVVAMLEQQLGGNAAANLYGKECEWDSGSTANVIGVVCWFVAGLFMVGMGPPQGGVANKTNSSPPSQTQEVHYELETAPDGTQKAVETHVVKGAAVTAAKEEPEQAAN